MMTFIVIVLIAAAALAACAPSYAVVNTGLLTRGLRGDFFKRMEQLQPQVHYSELATRVVSDGHEENYRWLGTVPQVREWGTGRIAKGLRTESYSVRNLKYEATIEVDRDEISDDQTGQIAIRVQELAQRAMTHKDYLIARLLENGSEAGFNSYDGKPFFDTQHESGASGEQANEIGAGASDPTSPTAAEFRESFKKAIAQLLTFTDDQGEPMNLGMSGLVCVVPPLMFPGAMEALQAAMLANSSNVFANFARVIPFGWLAADSTDWYLLKTDGAMRPFVFQDREPLEFQALTENSEQNFHTEKFLYGVRARYALAYGYWQHAVRVTFS